MYPRLSTEWLCCLALYAVSFWYPTRGVSVPVRTPPSNPSTIEAQAKFFQDFFSVQLSPYKIEFGHVCEDPNTWEQRYEKKDFKNHRDMGKVTYRHLPTSEDFDQGHRLGSDQHFTERHERSRPRDGLFSAKVRWGDKKGGYGEHYWDLNHAGHTADHGDDGYDNGSDDGSYHDESSDPYDEPSENSPTYGSDEYNPEKASYDEAGRAKRAHPKIKVERKQTVETYEEDQPKLKRKHKEQLQTAATHQVETKEDKKRRYQYNPRDTTEDVEYQPNEKKQVVLVVSHKDKDTESQQNNQQNEYLPKRQQDVNQFVPYESGAGVRQRQHSEVAAAASVPRLFLEPSTGHVVDRTTGQAYVLQPVNKY